MADSFDSFRQFIHASLALWKVPGVAVAVMKGEDVLLKEGLGCATSRLGCP